MSCFNETRCLWVVVKRIANLPNRDLEDRVGDKCSRPNRIEEIVFSDELARSRDQVIKHCESLGPQLDDFRASPELLVCQIEAEGIEHDALFVPHISNAGLRYPHIARYFIGRNSGSFIQTRSNASVTKTLP